LEPHPTLREFVYIRRPDFDLAFVVGQGILYEIQGIEAQLITQKTKKKDEQEDEDEVRHS